MPISAVVQIIFLDGCRRCEVLQVNLIWCTRWVDSSLLAQYDSGGCTFKCFLSVSLRIPRLRALKTLCDAKLNVLE